MKKHILSVTAFLLIFHTCTGQIFISKNSKVSFFSETPLENIQATNNTVASLINAANDSVLVKIKNSAFEFRNALMQDHFNENYMESSKYPVSFFRGKIDQKISYSKDGSNQVTATGKMLIHGVERAVTLKGILAVKGNEVTLSSQFTVKLADYNISIPKIVFNKIAEEVKVSFAGSYHKQQ